MRSVFNLLWSSVQTTPTDECFSIKAFSCIDPVLVSVETCGWGLCVLCHRPACCACSSMSNVLINKLNLELSPKGGNKLKVPSFFDFSTILQKLSSPVHPHYPIIQLTSWHGWPHIWHNYLSGFNCRNQADVVQRGRFCTMWWTVCQNHWNEPMQHFLELEMWKITL